MGWVPLYFASNITRNKMDKEQMGRLQLFVDESYFNFYGNEDKYQATTLANAFFEALRSKVSPVICTTPFILAFLQYCQIVVHENGADDVAYSNVVQGGWKCFAIPQSRLFILIPCATTKDQNVIDWSFWLDVDGLSEVDLASSLPEYNALGELYNDLVRQHTFSSESNVTSFQEKKVVQDPYAFDPAKIKALFARYIRPDRPQPKWNIVWTGHGHLDAPYYRKDANGELHQILIAGVTIPTIKKMLALFDDMNARSVTLITCFAGEVNRSYLTATDSLGGRYSYILTLLASSNRVVTFNYRSGKRGMLNFFKALESFSPNWLHEALSYIDNQALTEYLGNGPQFLIPGSDDYQVFLPVKEAKSGEPLFIQQLREKTALITNQYVQLAREPIKKRGGYFSTELKEKLFLYVYPTIIDVPLTITPTIKHCVQKHEPFGPRDQMIFFAASGSWLPKDDNYFFKPLHLYFWDSKDTDFYLWRFPIFQSMLKDNHFHAFSSIKLVLPVHYTQEEYRYTKKINPQNDYEYFVFEKKQSVIKELGKNGKPYHAGILAFLQYAFLSIAGRLSKHTFFIKELSGFNDFARVYRAELTSIEQELNNIKKQSAHYFNYKSKCAEIKKMVSFQEKNITLEDVLIQTEAFGEDTYAEKVTIFFRYDSKYWQLNYDQKKEGMGDKFTVPWNFKEIAPREALEQYRKLTESTIMKKKIIVADRTDKPSYDWFDFQKVEEYDSRKLLLFQLFDLYPKVRALRGRKNELKKLSDEAARREGSLHYERSKQIYEEQKAENPLGLNRLKKKLEELSEKLKKLRVLLVALAGKL